VKKIKTIFLILFIFLIYHKKTNSEIKDGLFATVGNKAITKSDIINEIKMIMILNNMTFSIDKKQMLETMATKSVVKRSIKEIAIENRKNLPFSQDDVVTELSRIAKRINKDTSTLKKICEANGLDFSLVKKHVETNIKWNSLIFSVYRERIFVNDDEIEEQLKLVDTNKEIYEYLLSEILFKLNSNDNVENKISELKNKIDERGFKNVAISDSIAETAINGGYIGWRNENAITSKYLPKIINTEIGNLSKPIMLPEGILIFYLEDKRKIKKKIDLKNIKAQLINAEKMKILNMYSLSHYDNLRRSMTINFLQN
jgi:peptidyl-prolyl cis-trans isomerase SurA